jgi:hypothetical protein
VLQVKTATIGGHDVPGGLWSGRFCTGLSEWFREALLHTNEVSASEEVIANGKEEEGSEEEGRQEGHEEEGGAQEEVTITRTWHVLRGLVVLVSANPRFLPTSLRTALNRGHVSIPQP